MSMPYLPYRVDPLLPLARLHLLLPHLSRMLCASTFQLNSRRHFVSVLPVYLGFFIAATAPITKQNKKEKETRFHFPKQNQN